ncbi:hypothetical protein R1flu_018236 [Riccia fluitans]|uniref:Uncharacterized protein n=1 Tax=Riccia fluitans TaxID=41844 RepID=A0ABD1ZFA1_9MARC
MRSTYKLRHVGSNDRATGQRLEPRQRSSARTASFVLIWPAIDTLASIRETSPGRISLMFRSAQQNGSSTTVNGKRVQHPASQPGRTAGSQEKREPQRETLIQFS